MLKFPVPSLQGATPSILLVDDDPAVIQVLSKTLSGLGRLRFATSGADALRLAQEEVPDLVLLDAEMPGMSGFETWEAMRSLPPLKDLPVMFVTSHGEEAMEERGLALGAADFIAKPVRPTILLARVRTQLRLKLALDKLRALAGTDSLTGLANRRSLDESLNGEWLRARRMLRPMSVLLIDVDHFKRFNDRYGHLKGDEALMAVTRVLKESASRPGDVVARYGGEEFAVLLPETNRAGAAVVARAILAHMDEFGIPHEASELGHLTVSIGAATYQPVDEGQGSASVPRVRPAGDAHDEMPIEAVLALADEALYESKRNGRAQVSFTDIAVQPW